MRRLSAALGFLVAVMLLANGCGSADTRTRAERRADSLALVASGGVRTDSGAVPMRVSRGRMREGDEWERPEPVDPEPGRNGDGDGEPRMDVVVPDLQHAIEMQADEAIAAAQAQAEAETAAAMEEMHLMLDRQRDEMREQRRTMRRQRRERERTHRH